MVSGQRHAVVVLYTREPQTWQNKWQRENLMCRSEWLTMQSTLLMTIEADRQL
jgi:hypothetical protein